MNTQKQLKQTITSIAPQLKTLAAKIHKNPELGYEEFRACAWQVELLRKWGFKVTTPYAKLKTAYKAVFGKGKPVFCIMAEYDALPVIGHACGHNLIATAAIGAGKALADALKKEGISGQVVVMGTPAEESKGGKVKLVAAGALKGIDVAVLAHPSWRSTADAGAIAVQRVNVAFAGHSAHAAASPELGKNALDAVMLLFAGVNAYRQHLPAENCRIHGVVRDGGVAPNIIPDHASCSFFLRALDDDLLPEMVKRFNEIATGAAMMTDTKAIITPGDLPYKSHKPNQPLNDAFMTAGKKAGLNPIIPERSGRGSSDFGDVSQVVPGVHVYFGIAKKQIAGHSPEFAEAAGSAFGLAQALKAAQALATMGYQYFTDPTLSNEVQEYFLNQKASRDS